MATADPAGEGTAARTVRAGERRDHSAPKKPLAGRRVSRDSLIAWGVLLVPVIVIGFAYWPGQMNVDMLSQIGEVASGQFTNQHAPILQALWHPLWELGFGPGWVLLGQLLAFVAGAYLILRAAFPRIPAAVVTAAIAVSPPLFSDLGSMQRDVWFAVLLVLTFGLVVRAAQLQWPWRGRVLALAVAAAWLTLASRQNAAFALVCACVVIAGMALERRREVISVGGSSKEPKRPRLLVGALAGGVALTLALIGTQIAASHAIGVRDAHPESTLFIYDLAAVSVRERENAFPADVMSKRGIAAIDRRYDVDAMHAFTFFPGAPIEFPFSSTTAESLRSGWWETVREHPRAYLDARWDLWLREIALTRSARNPYERPMNDNGGFPFAFPSLNWAALDYMEIFGREGSQGEPIDGGPLFAVWVYLLAALAGAIVLLRRGRPWTLLAVGALSLSALTNQLGVFLAVMHNAYRFEFPSVVVGALTAAVLVRLAWMKYYKDYPSGSGAYMRSSSSA
jgi:hypothetical protein